MWRWILRPLLFMLDAERAHHLTMRLFAALVMFRPMRALVRWWYGTDDARLHVKAFGLDFAGPVGLAAGFDKDARWYNALHALGFDFVEVGTLTGQEQAGNPRPRLFRIPADRALLNRFGFNNRGSEAAAADLRDATIEPLLGVNIGKSKVVPNEDAASDYLASLERLQGAASYIAVNVSSPNTKGLRDLQQADTLRALLDAICRRNETLAADRGATRPPVMVKIAPDMTDEQVDEIVALCREVGIDGIIATNTTVARDSLSTPAGDVEALGAGGLSGAPLTERSRTFVARLYRKVDGAFPVIGVGGIMSGDDAWEMMRAGASLVQVYSGFVYGGPSFVRDIHRTLQKRLDERGLDSISTIVGEAA
jgi:dihydroorotate dehydrogenase